MSAITPEDVTLYTFTPETPAIRTAHDGFRPENGGGASVSLAGRPAPVTGYMVGGVVPEYRTRTCTLQTLADFANQHADELTGPNAGSYFLGVWQGPEFVHLDVSEHIDDREIAICYARARGELAIWDCAAGREITLRRHAEGPR